MSSTLADAAGPLPEDAELWQMFMLYEDQLTDITDPPEVDDMSSAKAQKVTDTLTVEDQNETVRHLSLSEIRVTNLLERSSSCLTSP